MTEARDKRSGAWVIAKILGVPVVDVDAKGLAILPKSVHSMLFDREALRPRLELRSMPVPESWLPVPESMRTTDDAEEQSAEEIADRIFSPYDAPYSIFDPAVDAGEREED